MCVRVDMVAIGGCNKGIRVEVNGIGEKGGYERYRGG